MKKLYVDTIGNNSIIGTLLAAFDMIREVQEDVKISYVEAPATTGTQLAEARRFFSTDIELLNLKETIEEIEENSRLTVTQAGDGRYEVSQDWVFCGYHTAEDIQQLWMDMPEDSSRENPHEEIERLEAKVSGLESELEHARQQRDHAEEDVNRLREERRTLKDEKQDLKEQARRTRGELMKAVGAAYGNSTFDNASAFFDVVEATGKADPVIIKEWIGANKVQAIKALRSASTPKLGLRRAKELVESLPTPDEHGLPTPDEEGQKLAVFGATGEDIERLEKHFRLAIPASVSN